MPWVKLDTGFWTHPKISKAGLKLAVKHQRAMCWSAEHGTNGVIPVSMRREFGLNPSQILRLIELRLWDEFDQDHYVIHDWNVFNPDGELAKHDRDDWERKRQAMRAKWREDKRRQREMSTGMSTEISSGQSDGRPHGSPRARAGDTSRPVTSRPLDSDSDGELQSTQSEPDDAEIWAEVSNGSGATEPEPSPGAQARSQVVQGRGDDVRRERADFSRAAEVVARLRGEG